MNNYNHDQVLNYWEKNEVESMYDKYLLQAEIELIRKRIEVGSKLLDAGCGECEGTAVYSKIPGVEVHAADFSDMRLQKARERLGEPENVKFMKVDFVGEYQLEHDYDVVVCQRFLINITDWELQKKVILDLMGLIKNGGKLIMLEGFVQGVDALNQIRAAWGLPSIPVQWHNLFLDEEKLLPLMQQHGFQLFEEDGLGAYFFLTRGIRPALQTELNWDCDFNQISSSDDVRKLLGFKDQFSRLKLWVFTK